MKFDKDEFGKRLWQLRTKNGMTQEELGERIYYSHNTIHTWECGKAYPELNAVCAICNEFGITPNDLLMVNEKGAENGGSN